MDIISSLPDPILCHILSFLPVKFAVTTSVLARRWRFLWTYVRNLHFYGERYRGYGPESRTGFLDMVTVLLLHNGPIDTLSFHPCMRPNDDTVPSPCHIDACISSAIARNVHVLSLAGVQLPRSCFNCETLVELTAEECTIAVKPGVVCLPRLKKLNLILNSYEDDESLPNLVSGCSAIENLVIERNEDGCGMECCYVRSSTLKSLVLKFYVTCYALDHVHKLVLDVPAVQYLQLHDHVSDIIHPHVIHAEKLSSLLAADIKFSYDCEGSEVDISLGRDTFQFVEMLSTARSLTFRSSAPMKLLPPPSFIATTRSHNLTKLEFEADWHILTELLACASKLESITIQKVDDELKCWREPKHLPMCPLSSLKYINIFGFAGEEHELNMIRYMLRHAIVLKKIKIYSVSHGNGSKLNMLQRFRIFHEDLRNVGLLLFEKCKFSRNDYDCEYLHRRRSESESS